METMFTDFFNKFPTQADEYMVIHQIHYAMDCAEKAYKEDKDSQKHMKYMAKAYHMLQYYFNEKQVHPDHVDYK